MSALIRGSIVGSLRAAASCVTMLLLSGCQSRSEARDEMLAQQLSAEIEGALKPGADAAAIERVIKEKGWPLQFVGRGHIGFVPNAEVSSGALRVHIVVDEKHRFVAAKVAPSPNTNRPLQPFNP